MILTQCIAIAQSLLYFNTCRWFDLFVNSKIINFQIYENEILLHASDPRYEIAARCVKKIVDCNKKSMDQGIKNLKWGVTLVDNDSYNAGVLPVRCCQICFCGFIFCG